MNDIYYPNSGQVLIEEEQHDIEKKKAKERRRRVKPPVFNFRYISCNLSLYHHLQNSSVFSITGEKSCKTDVHLKRTYCQYPYKRVLRPSAF